MPVDNYCRITQCQRVHEYTHGLLLLPCRTIANWKTYPAAPLPSHEHPLLILKRADNLVSCTVFKYAACTAGNAINDWTRPTLQCPTFVCTQIIRRYRKKECTTMRTRNNMIWTTTETTGTPFEPATVASTDCCRPYRNSSFLPSLSLN